MIDKAITSCKNSNFSVLDHFVEVNKMIQLGKTARRKITEYRLSRYACYLIVQNADPSKEVVALGQTYFAIQTRKQEITEQEYESLSDDEKRQLLKEKDLIEFTNRTTLETILVEIVKLHKYSNFDELYKHFDKVSLGYDKDDIAKSNDMERYYSKEEQEKYGVIGIEIRIIDEGK